MAITIPKYVQNILERSQWKLPWYVKNIREGFYIFAIEKASDYETTRVFQREVERFLAWANREAKRTHGLNQQVAYLLKIPEKTHHRQQYAVVKITDPIMHDIEQYIVDEVKHNKYRNPWR